MNDRPENPAGVPQGAPAEPVAAAAPQNAPEQQVEQDLAALLAEAEGKRDEYLEMARRAQADFENFRKRMAAEVQAAALRGSGNVKVPATVTLIGALVLIPLSPLLIFGFGPVPRLGIAGAGIAFGLYYGAAMLFTSAKVTHLNLLPQGQPERYTRVVGMVEEMERYFGSCTNHGECEKACPKEISIDFIAMLNRDYVKAQFKNRKLTGQKA